MAFIIDTNQVISFAEYQDVIDKDQRLFDANEGLSDSIVESNLIRATERILSRIRSSEWWVNYNTNRNTGTYSSIADMPQVDANRILSRERDFTDLCVYTALSEYILPIIADFGTEDNAEYRKMKYYQTKAEQLFEELINSGDWYDFNDDGVIQSNEKQPSNYSNLRRVR